MTAVCCGQSAALDPAIEVDAGADSGAATGGRSGSQGAGGRVEGRNADASSTDGAPLSCPADGRCFDNGGLDLCCTASGACGAMYLGRSGAGCVSTSGGGRLDPSCPDSEEGPGCCLPNGSCGAFYSRAFGCVDPAVFPGFPPDKIPCGGMREAGDGLDGGDARDARGPVEASRADAL